MRATRLARREALSPLLKPGADDLGAFWISRVLAHRPISGEAAGADPLPGSTPSGWRRLGRVRNLLLRQRDYAGDVEKLAELLRELLGPAYIKALRAELGRRRQHA